MTEEMMRSLSVIGASANPAVDQLPLFMDPICADPEQPDACWLMNTAPWDGSEPRSSHVPREQFEQECELGYWLRLPAPFAFRRDHHLVALEPGEPPRYLSDAEASSEVVRLGKEALATVADALDRDALSEAMHERLWYAVRALPDDPLPMLTAIAVERTTLPLETLADLEKELPRPSGYRSALMEYARGQGWSGLLSLVENDPLGRRFLLPSAPPLTRAVPEYLQPYPDKPQFVQDYREIAGQAGFRTVA